MNITIFIGGISGGGAERVACNLANFLTEQKNSVTLLTMSETRNVYGVNPNVKLVSLLKDSEKKNKIWNNKLRYTRLSQYINTTDVDAFVVMLPITICLLLHFRKRIKGKIIASERNDPNANNRLIKTLLKRYGKRADMWVFQTENAAKWYEGTASKSVVIPNAINPAFIRPAYQGEKEKVIVAAGRLSEQKNFPLLLAAFAKIEQQFPTYSLRIFGKGPLEMDLKQKATDLGIADKVQFMGYVDDMPEQLERASMFVLSSDFEGMPNALMEAMASGLPCVSTDCGGGGARFLMNDGENGLLVPVGDVDAMADAMAKILSDRELADKLGKNAAEIKDKLSPESIYAKWEDAIKGVVNKQ